MPPDIGGTESVGAREHRSSSTALGVGSLERYYCCQRPADDVVALLSRSNHSWILHTQNEQGPQKKPLSFHHRQPPENRRVEPCRSSLRRRTRVRFTVRHYLSYYCDPGVESAPASAASPSGARISMLSLEMVRMTLLSMS